MKKRFLYLILPIITLILEILPYGAVLNFARPATDGSIGHFRELYSYFDLMPFGYANFAPFIAAIISCLVFLLVAIYCVKGNIRVAAKARNILYVAAVMSLGPLVLGVRYFSVVGGFITLTLIVELLLLHRAVRQK
ncbi:MAG: hypothetical protein IKT47_00035 [Oscillospiraceae bacterium]|nr:hypothetical protein [Oscillospiraceae bacterium]